MKDARLLQVLFLGILLSFGVLFRDFSLKPLQMGLCFAAGLGTQFFFIKLRKAPPLSLLSALVTCFGTALYLRCDNNWVHPLAIALAIASKFFIRFSGKHLFNPTNLAVIFSLCFLPGTWVSPGQWGWQISMAAWILVLGFAVAFKATRSGLSWTFLACYLSLCGLRALYLGQTLEVWEHQAMTGNLLVFSFFMISDPRTTPNHPLARFVYAASVALLAFIWQFGFFKVNGPIWALFFLCPTVPLYDHFFKSQAFAWATAINPNFRSRHA